MNVPLRNAADKIIMHINTDTNVSYSFTDLVPGKFYEVLVVDPAGFVFSPQDQGGDDTLDSNVNFQGRTGPIPLGPGENNKCIDAGLIDINGPPSFTKGADQTVLENAGPQTVVSGTDNVHSAEGRNFVDRLMWTLMFWTARMEKLEARRRPLWSTDLVIAEVVNFLANQTNVTFASQAGHRIYASSMLQIIRPQRDDDLAAITLMARYEDQAFSFTDCVSFVVMKQKKLKQAFCFDADFAIAGFELWKG